MARIPHEETPIYAQLLQEKAAQSAYDRFFNETGPLEEPTVDEQ